MTLKLCAERTHAERFGGIVAGVQHGNSEFCGFDAGVMRTLSHNQRIDPCGNGLAQRVARCTGTRAEGPTARPPVGRNSDAHQGPSFRARNDVGSRGKGLSVDVGISHYADEDRLVTGESLGGIKTKRAREQRSEERRVGKEC